MAAFNQEIWTSGHDCFGRFCWLNRITGRVSYNPWFEGSELPGPPQAGPFSPFPLVGQRVPLPQAAPAAPLAFNIARNPNVPAGIGFTAFSDPAVRDIPHQVVAAVPFPAGGPPGIPMPDKPKQKKMLLLPPPPPPRTPSPKRRPEKERDQWEVKQDRKGKKYFYNKKTGESTYDRPRCLKKYG